MRDCMEDRFIDHGLNPDPNTMARFPCKNCGAEMKHQPSNKGTAPEMTQMVYENLGRECNNCFAARFKMLGSKLQPHR